jgi:hypothetical protein
MNSVVQKIFYTAILIIISFSLSTCKKVKSDVDLPFTNTQRVKATIMGVVLDETGNPLQGAQVRIETHSTFTDGFGNFSFKDINVLKNATLVSVNAYNCFKAFKTLMIVEGQENYTRIRLIKKTTPQTFNASSGGLVTLQNNGSISFEPNSIVTENGQAYTGPVNVFSHLLKASDQELSERIPGALRGVTIAGAEQILETFGMLAVELYGTNGQRLNLAPGKKAEIKMPIEANQYADAPQTIPLWHFNESNGMWIEEGAATKSNLFYVGSVSHFSWWNWDINYMSNILNLSLTDINNNPIKHAKVVLSTSTSSFALFTSNNGTIKTRVALNTAYTLSVNNACNVVSHTQSFQSNLSNITLNVSNVNISPAASSASIVANFIGCGNLSYYYDRLLIKDTSNFTYTAIFDVDSNGLCNANIPGCFNLPSTKLFLKSQYIDNFQAPIPIPASLNLGVNNLGTINYCPYPILPEFNLFCSDTPSQNLIFEMSRDILNEPYNKTAEATYDNSTGLTTIEFKNYEYSYYQGIGPLIDHYKIVFDGGQSINTSHYIKEIDLVQYSVINQAANTQYLQNDPLNPPNIPITITQYGNGELACNFNGYFTKVYPQYTETFHINGNFKVVAP